MTKVFLEFKWKNPQVISFCYLLCVGKYTQYNEGNKIGNVESIWSSTETSAVKVRAQVPKPDKKKRKVTETSTNDGDNDDSNPGKRKPFRPRSWTWEHFTRDPSSKPSNARPKCNWCGASNICDSHRNGTTNMRYDLLNQCKKFPKNLTLIR